MNIAQYNFFLIGCLYIYIYIYTHTHTHTYIHTHTRARVCVCVCVRARARNFVVLMFLLLFSMNRTNSKTLIHFWLLSLFQRSVQVRGRA